MAQALPKRSELPVELTWNLTTTFTSDASCREVLKELQGEVDEFVESFKGRLQKDGAEGVVKALKAYENIVIRLSRVMVYTSLRRSTDMGDSSAVRLAGEAAQKASELSSRLSFFQDELAKLSSKNLTEAAQLAPQYNTYLTDIAAWQTHMLDPKVEESLAKLSPSLSLPEDVYEVSKAADMHFPDFCVDGKSYPLSYVLYESHYCEEPDTAVRRQAFSSFSDTLRQYHNTVATVYNAQVQQEKIIANLRGFDSVIDYLLFHQKVGRKLYDQHIDLTMEKFAPVMRRWAKVLQKKHGLDEMHYADLKLVYDPTGNPTVAVEDASAYISEAMQPMGQEYHDLVMRFKEERWVDFARNQGKSTGGFCTSVWKGQPYILLNWNDSLSELYTLAHELGHAAQGLICEANNSFLESDFTWYDVESPSTFHEMLLSHSFMRKAKGDKLAEARVAANMIENTYYHNFVTHFLEAYYQREVYRMVDAGEQLQAEDFDRIYQETLEKFWGDAVVLDPGAELTWMRQPHYYMGLYSYTYSASLVISTQMYLRLMAEGESAAKDWLNFLAAGGPMAPIDHARIAKIDISDTKSLEQTIDFMASLVEIVEAAQN